MTPPKINHPNARREKETHPEPSQCWLSRLLEPYVNPFKQQPNHHSGRRKYWRSCRVREKRKQRLDARECDSTSTHNHCYSIEIAAKPLQQRLYQVSGLPFDQYPGLLIGLYSVFVTVSSYAKWTPPTPNAILLFFFLRITRLVFCGCSTGKGVVSEQEDEVETSERRSTGGCSEGKRTGEREKGDIAAVRILRHSGSSSLHRLPGQREQSRQRPEFWACSLMMHGSRPRLLKVGSASHLRNVLKRTCCLVVVSKVQRC